MIFVDVLIARRKLTQEDYERWRFRRIFCLERFITTNLVKVTSKVFLESSTGALSGPCTEAPLLELIAGCRARPG